jgi:hypothetical protein
MLRYRLISLVSLSALLLPLAHAYSRRCHKQYGPIATLGATLIPVKPSRSFDVYRIWSLLARSIHVSDLFPDNRWAKLLTRYLPVSLNVRVECLYFATLYRGFL